MGFNDWQSTSTFEVSGAPLMTLENRGERIKKQRIIFSPDRTHNRSRSPRLAASSDSKKASKGSRQLRSVTLGKGLALRVEGVGFDA